VHELLAEFVQKIFASEALFALLNFIREKENTAIRSTVSSEHMEIIESLTQV